ncbi:wd g-beta repeat-containing protein [Cystoisospora suis]|uniref:Wd g-beta repeat-containing protein n=1 Tax=Cystoisospora suis TaxID=483139 RepID=A0A2C6KW67_9APIC|nr:wd g-beta repeat-containing protein [Cystoisospora suis]
MVFEHEGRVPIHSISGVCTAHVPHYVFMAVASGSIMAWDLRSNFSWEMTRPVRRQAVNLVSVSRLNTEIAVVTKYNSFNTFSLLSAPFSSSTSCGTPSSQSPCGSPSVLSSSSCVGSIFLSHRSQFFPHGPNNGKLPGDGDEHEEEAAEVLLLFTFFSVYDWFSSSLPYLLVYPLYALYTACSFVFKTGIVVCRLRS